MRVLAGPKALVFGVRCDDPDPARIVTFTKERDGDFENEDHIVIVLDTFQDGRSGLRVRGEPGGARYDALVEPGGEEVDANWDGVWEAGDRPGRRGLVGRDPHPAREPELQARPQGVGLQRPAPHPAPAGNRPLGEPAADYEVTQTSRAGLLTGLPRFDLGLGPRRAPRSGRRVPEPSARTRRPTATLELSLDVTQRLGANMLASLTVNTDFAETEVDTRRTNLTRFPLFFPEKRTFFLEGSDIFAFGLGTRRRDVLPFFSRRIGLVEGQEVPLLAGLKVTGRAGQTNFGGLVVRTREEPGVGCRRPRWASFGSSRTSSTSRASASSPRSAIPSAQRELARRGGPDLPDLPLSRRQELPRRHLGPRDGPRATSTASATGRRSG